MVGCQLFQFANEHQLFLLAHGFQTGFLLGLHFLQTLDGRLDSLEVGKEAYKERRQIYEHLRINNHKGELLHSTDWLIVTEITESDILNLAKSVICDDDFEVDLFVNAKLSNPVKKIIYQKISE